MHINELENRMRRNSLDVKSLNQRNLHASESETSSSSRDNTINADRYMNGGLMNSASFNDRGDTNEIMTIHRHDMRRESLLDDLCDSLTDKSSHYSPSVSTTTTATITRIKKLEFIGGGSVNNNSAPLASNLYSNETHNGNNHASKSNGCVVNGRLDEKKKTKLLAALKNIDNNGSSLEN